MRKVGLLLALCALMTTTLTSCWEFNREQTIKDARAMGEAKFVESENSKKVLIEDAKAKNESSTLQAQTKVTIAKAEAQAEIERAKGVAEANRIIGESLKGNSEYLRYLQIDAIRNSQGDKIYIPTEAGLPILEARN